MINRVFQLRLERELVRVLAESDIIFVFVIFQNLEIENFHRFLIILIGLGS